ncbi:MAG: ligase [Candidatus Binatus sp.]|nr:ligase [Candidatus Binatus sp.]
MPPAKRISTSPGKSRERPPRVYLPELPTLVKTPPAGNQWAHEIKYDGYRIGCRIDDGHITLITRNGKDWTEVFPAVVDAAMRLSVENALLDGEVAVVLPDGRTSFQALQNALKEPSPPQGEWAYFVFDLLFLNGVDWSPRPLLERKQALEKLLRSSSRKPMPVFRYSAHVIGNGDRFFAEACRAHLEGIVSKRIDLPRENGRSRNWLKTKCTRRQEFVIGGYTDPEGSREGIGALLVGVYDRGRLIYAGKVGTGFNRVTLIDLKRRLARLAQKTCPFDVPPPGALARKAHWVRPELVAEVSFTEWTSDGRLRHPSFQGLREDKPASEVVHERPEAAPPPTSR